MKMWLVVGGRVDACWCLGSAAVARVQAFARAKASHGGFALGSGPFGAFSAVQSGTGRLLQRLLPCWTGCSTAPAHCKYLTREKGKRDQRSTFSAVEARKETSGKYLFRDGLL